jgi:hypothetical protein
MNVHRIKRSTFSIVHKEREFEDKPRRLQKDEGTYSVFRME